MKSSCWNVTRPVLDGKHTLWLLLCRKIRRVMFKHLFWISYGVFGQLCPIMDEKVRFFSCMQTCTGLKFFVITYLLFWPAFILRIFFWEENSTRCLLKTDKKKLVQRGKFSTVTLFSEGSSLKFSYPKRIVKWNKSVQVNLCQKHSILNESVNPQYDHRLFIELQVQYKKNTNSEHVYKNSFFVLTFKTIFVHNMFWTCIFLLLNS